MRFVVADCDDISLGTEANALERWLGVVDEVEYYPESKRKPQKVAYREREGDVDTKVSTIVC